MKFTGENYHALLCSTFPEFITPYLELPLLKRLNGIGLLCGTDWTPLFHNRFYYSRLDHSVGVALIIWNFTHDKKQTIAGLLHDVSTPTFSHVLDFKNGDALKQESTEDLNKSMIDGDEDLKKLLAADGLCSEEVDDYHIYPIADNKMPGLSSDRLEYMYPSGAALDEVWNIEDVARNYKHILVLENEKGEPELGFDDESEALKYTKKFCDISLILQRHEDKIAMQLLADVLSQGEKCGFVAESEYYSKSEAELISRFDTIADEDKNSDFTRLYKTFRSMKNVTRSTFKRNDCYCLSMEVKKRYINPLVKDRGRIAAINSDAEKIISDFFAYEDAPFGCVEWAELHS